ncbi:MAG TPA: DUF58 domain-containing protein [Saprospiraceae bacterium]|nr:DUF58 domain-containing protein [Saprospiraceae bacterium]
MTFIKKIFSGLYIHPRFYYFGIGVIVLMVISFFLPILFLPAQIVFYVLLLFLLFDILLLFNAHKGIQASRLLPEKLSNGDQNEVVIELTNYYGFKVTCEIIDEIPEEFQVRDFMMTKVFEAKEFRQMEYHLRPTFRGNVEFGRLIVFVISPLSLIKRRFSSVGKMTIPVYPSFIQLNKYEIGAFSNKLTQHGMKKVRRLGHSMEFEKIKEYVPGDDFRTVNWKATAKANKMMVNQYQDERSQAIYCIIDKGRTMKMPFDGLSLLDYAINASLVVSGIALRKQDYAGFMSFSRRVDNRVVASRKAMQHQLIMEALYNVKTDFYETDYGKLYGDIRKNISHRSLLLLFTNFETMDGLNRQLPYLKAIARSHLLIVIFFQNTELDAIIHHSANNTQEIFDKIIAEKFVFEKKLIVHELKKYGIHSILTKPENLTIDTINKYLEIKARGMI